MRHSGFDPHRRAQLMAAAGAVVLVFTAACSRSPVSVDSSAVEVRAIVSPVVAAASESPDGDSVRVVVSVTNPQVRPVVVQLGGPPYKSGQIPAAETHGIGFGVRVLATDSVGRAQGRGPSQWTWGQPTMALGARATLRHTFVVRVAAQPVGDLSVTPGWYRVIASFGRQEAAPVELRVLP